MNDLGLISLMAQLQCRPFWGATLIPAFIIFFQKLYPFAWINDPSRNTAGAAGGCMLVRRDTLEAIGSIAVIKDRIIDDCALAAEIKRRAPIRLYLSTRARSLRAYDRLDDVWKMVRRTAFVQLNRSVLLLGAVVAGMIVVYAVPPVATLWGWTVGNSQIWAPGVSAWIIMSVAYMPTVARYQQPSWCVFLLPLAAVMYTLMTLDSARLHLIGKAPAWKDRRYPSVGET